MTDDRPHPYAAKTDEGRAAQLANLNGSRPPSHGLRSRVVMAPLREQAEEWALKRWPQLDDTRRHLVASLAARVERVRIWSDSNDILIGGVVVRFARIRLWIRAIAGRRGSTR